MAQSEEQIILDVKVNYQQAIQGIADCKTRINELRAAQRELTNTFGEGAITENEYRKNMAVLDEQIKHNKDDARVLSREIQNQIKVEKMQEGSLASLRAELSRATRAYDTMSRAEREGAKGKELKNHINEITNELKAAEGETQRFYRNVGNYENAIKNALGLNTNFGKSLEALRGMGGGNMFQGLMQGVQSFGQSLMGLMANPAFLALAGIAGAGAAFKWFFDYNQELAEATRLTKEFTGLTGAPLEDLRNSIQATADTFGKDYTETLQTVDALTSQYHMSAKEALQVVNDGFIAGADLSGDMLDKINNYAPTFHDAGIAADEMVAIIAQTRSGIFSDGGLDAISMASKKLREMSSSTASSLDAIGISSKQVSKDLADGTKSTFDVIQEVSARLKELPQNGQEVGNALKDVFGKQAAEGGLQLIESLDGISTKMEEVKAQTGEYGELQEQQIEATKELNDAMSALFDVSQGGFEEMILQVKVFATKWLAAAIRGVIKFINRCIDFYNNSLLIRGIIANIVAGFKMLWTTVKTAFNLIVNGAKAAGKSLEGIAYILEGIVTLSFDKVKKGFNEITSSVVNMIKDNVGDIKNAGAEYAAAFTGSFEQAANSRLKHIEVATGAADGLAGDGGGNVGAGTGSGSGSGGSGKGTGGKSGKVKSAADKAAEAERKAVEAAKKKEEEEIRKANELILQLIVDGYERQREQTKASYDKRIEDIKKKLAEEKNLTAATRDALNSQITSLEELKNRALAKLDDDHLKQTIERETKVMEMRLSVLRKGTVEEYNLRLQSLQNNEKLEISAANAAAMETEEREALIFAIKQKYANETAKLNDEFTKALEEEIKKRYDIQTLQMQTGGTEANPELAALRLDLQMRKELLANAQRYELETEEEFLARKLQMERDAQTAAEAVADKEVEIQVSKAEAIGSVIAGLGDIAEEYGDKNKELGKLAKVLALAEIAVNTGAALASGIRQAQSVPYPGNIAAIATTVATILANIATAIKTVKSAKFAHGGLVEGEGTETSDSIPARLSNGESVITARATRMFAPALSVMNQLGGGVAIPGRGGDVGVEFMARAVAMGVSSMPRPVVSVEEIDRVRNRVEVIEKQRSV